MPRKGPGRPVDDDEPLDEPDDEDEHEFDDGFQIVEPGKSEDEELDDLPFDPLAGDDDDILDFFD